MSAGRPGGFAREALERAVLARRPHLLVAVLVATPPLVAGHLGLSAPCRHARRIGCYPETGTGTLVAGVLAVLALSVAVGTLSVALVGWFDHRLAGGRIAAVGERPLARLFVAPGRRALLALGVVLGVAIAAVLSGPVTHPPAVPGLRATRRVLLAVLFLPEVLAVAVVDWLIVHYRIYEAPVEVGALAAGATLGAAPQVAWWYGLAHLLSGDRSFLHGAARPGVLSSPGRRRMAVAAVLAVVVLAGGTGAVRVLDPGSDYATHAVDPSDPPAEVVHDALLQVEEGRYTVDVAVHTRGPDGMARVEAPPGFEGRPIVLPVREPAPPARRLRVDVPDRQIRIARLHGGGAETTWFGNARLGWRHDDRWRVHPADYGGAWTYPLTLLLNEDAVTEDHAEFSVLARDESTLVARIDGEAAASNLVDANVGGRFTRCRFVVDREVGRLRRVTCQSSDRRPDRVLELRFSDWGRDLRRPDGARYTLHELVLDIRDVGEIHDTAPPRNTPAREEGSDDRWDREDE